MLLSKFNDHEAMRHGDQVTGVYFEGISGLVFSGNDSAKLLFFIVPVDCFQFGCPHPAFALGAIKGDVEVDNCEVCHGISIR